MTWPPRNRRNQAACVWMLLDAFGKPGSLPAGFALESSPGLKGKNAPVARFDGLGCYQNKSKKAGWRWQPCQMRRALRLPNRAQGLPPALRRAPVNLH